ncbi:L-arabinose isomerase [Nanchangia anserum]|uniref:L-arabinose isomerase n=1 Tax=Nanchangia anserum TaxID=2692125 RepID=A0A8I0GBP9_9ACTO|nr:L-arabinose isomerase [Nanchangia anserum]MBD3689833.1 L-arabinose isomerase [Nanchangia anserum]QOX82002.1 L-arabinose isomerase [Nanchangia anserum]
MRINPYSGREIWFLTGSQDLYGPEALACVEEQSRALVAILNDSAQLPLKVVWKPVCKERDGIRRIVLDANADNACVGVMMWMHTFSPAKNWVLGLKALDVPLMHLHTQASPHLPWSSIDMDYMNLNQSAHGDREFGYILTRMGIRRKTVVGHVSYEHTRREIATWMRAAVGWAELHETRVARIGDNMRNVAVTEGDKTEAEIALGVAVNTWPVNEAVDAVASVGDADVETLIEEYVATYRVAGDLMPGAARHNSLREAARQEIGLRRFLADRNASAFTDTFEDLGGLKQLPGLAVQRLMAEGYGFGAEGDWKTAVLVRLAKVMGYGLPGGASLMEDYCYEMAPGSERILGAHMLEICPSLTGSTPSLEIHPLDIGGREDPVRLVFDTDPGEAVVVALSDMRDRFRLTANVVDVVGPSEPLDNLPVASAVWVPRPDFSTSVRCWLAAGGAHHTVMTTQCGLDVWRDFATVAEMELAAIDSDTSVTAFEDRLAWNNVYWRMAQSV